MVDRAVCLLGFFCRKHQDSKKEEEKKKPHIKKPLNAFMLYMKEMRAKVVAECTLKESAAINQILGRRVGDPFHGREAQGQPRRLWAPRAKMFLSPFPWSSRLVIPDSGCVLSSPHGTDHRGQSHMDDQDPPCQLTGSADCPLPEGPRLRGSVICGPHHCGVGCDVVVHLSLPTPHCPLQWHALSREEQAKYYELARKERQLHMQLYPGWSARDNYVGGSFSVELLSQRCCVCLCGQRAGSLPT